MRPSGSQGQLAASPCEGFVSLRMGLAFEGVGTSRVEGALLWRTGSGIRDTPKARVGRQSESCPVREERALWLSARGEKSLNISVFQVQFQLTQGPNCLTRPLEEEKREKRRREREREKKKKRSEDGGCREGT